MQDYPTHTISARGLFWKGFLDTLPYVLMVVPFGVLFGVIATEAGLPIAQVLGFSVTIIAGAAQFTAVSLMQDNAPTIVVILTALAVNLRMAMYSATLAPFLGGAPFWQKAFMAYGLFDLNFIMADTKFRQKTEWTSVQKAFYFSGTSLVIIVTWVLATYLGALGGQALPDWLELDFALPLSFVAMVAPTIRSLPHVAAAISSVVFALAFAPIPFGLGLLLAACIAMLIGAEVERRLVK